MLDPTISDHPRSRHCGRASVAATAVAVLLLAGCTGSTAAPPEAGAEQVAVTVRTSGDIIDFDDGLDHYVVSTVNDPTRIEPDVAPAPAPVAQPEPETPEVATTVTAAAVVAAGTLVTDDPPAELVPVTANGTTERAALDAAGPGSLVVADVHGLVGESGRRYLRTLDGLYEISGAMVETVETVDTAPEATHAPAPVTADAAIRDAVDAVDGVVAAEIVGVGILAVTTEPTTDAHAVAAVTGVTDVSDEVVLGLAADSRQPLQWALENTGDPAQANGTTGIAGADTDADLAWSVSTGAGTVVAIIDSGVDLAHPDLAPNIWSNPAETCGNGIDDDANGYVDDCHGWDFGDRDGDPNPTFGAHGAEHGTHVAGIVAGVRNGTGIVGIAPDAMILPLKVSDSVGRITMSSLAAAITYASRYADVINMSLGTSPGTPREYVADLEAAVAVAGRAGVTVVTAMGNDGVDISTRPVWPASFASVYDHVIAVGASTNGDTRAYFSNTGSPLTIYAPGWAIMSSLPTTGWGFLYGTSMATPAVAGAAASVLASGTARTPADVRSRLVATARPTSAGPRLDVAAAVGYVPPAEVAELAVTLAGADRLVPDTASTLTWTVVTRDPSSAVALRLSVAARDGGTIGAVGGLDAAFRTADGVDLGTLVTDERGEFPPIAVDANTFTTGMAIGATVALPAAEYAFVAELVDASGLAVSPAVANFVSVTALDSTNPTSPPTLAPADPNAPVTPTSTLAPSTPPNPAAPTTTRPPGAPGGGGGSGAPTSTTEPHTDAPGTPGTPATTRAPGSGTTPTAPVTTPATTAAPSTPGATVPADTVAATVPAGPATTAPAGSVTTTTQAPVWTPPASTIPAPDPAGDGDHRAVSITPRAGSTAGGTLVTIDGSFPTTVPVYVWFGDSWSTSVRADASGTRITVATPPVPFAGTRDVIIRFTADRAVELRLVDAFEFTDGTTSAPTTPTMTPTTTTPTPGPGGGAVGGATTVPPSPTTTVAPPAPTVPTPTVPTPTVPTPTVPTPTPPGTTTPGTTVSPTRPLGRLTLRTVPAGSALSGLHISAWPGTGCRTASCPGTGL